MKRPRNGVANVLLCGVIEKEVSMSRGGRKARFSGILLALALLPGCNPNGGGPLQNNLEVITYHYDNYRSGWNLTESTLTSANIMSSRFGQLYDVALDDQVDAQPLLLSAVNVTGKGMHDVVYVATENNTVFMIDTTNGSKLASRFLGPPVPSPLGCINNGPNVGINGTPVIDPQSMTLYVIAYTGPTPTYTLWALDARDLSTKNSTLVFGARHLSGGGVAVASFDAIHQRQRPGLLEANGNIYAGFGSFCDFGGSNSRGWILGWNASTLAPLAANGGSPTSTLTSAVLQDQLTGTNLFWGRYLSSIWMSGYGIAADDVGPLGSGQSGMGNIYFVTGNSDGTFDGVSDVQESVVKLSADLTSRMSIFTPAGQPSLDAGDTDFGSGGVLLLPRTPTAAASMAAAAGKDGNLYLLDSTNLGGTSAFGIGSTPVQIGACWCGQSYFSNGAVHIVTSGASQVMMWTVQTSPSLNLALSGFSVIQSGQDGGFFTSVSSNGLNSSSDPVIWAVSRPTDLGGAINLWAFKATVPNLPGAILPPLLRGVNAGRWASHTADADIVPVVANGRVFVASYKNLRAFGLH
jgi:hypothetical protein